jgi:hypothetical protein
VFRVCGWLLACHVRAQQRGEPFDALRLLRAFDSLFPSRSSFLTLIGESRPAMSERSESNGGGGNCTRVPDSASRFAG